jgi:general secretion pathway protein D
MNHDSLPPVHNQKPLSSVNRTRDIMPGRFLVLTLLFATLPSFDKAQAQANSSFVDPSLAAANERAVVRSQESLIQAQSLMKEAMEKRSRHNLEGAYQNAVSAIALAPSGGALQKQRQTLVSDYTLIALDYSRNLIQNGHYQEAETAAKSVLEPSVNPGNKDAVKLLSNLEQPEIFNKSVTPKLAVQREQVVKLLRDANGYAQSGRFDLALKQYDAVLLIDPYNMAARQGMEAVHKNQNQYSDEAYNETRSQMLWQVEKAWERPPHKGKPGRSTESVGRQQDLRGTDQIEAKLNTIIIPKIDLNDSPISEAVEYLKQKSVEQDPSKKGVNIFLKLGDRSAPSAPAAAGAGTTAPATTPAPPAATTPDAEPHVTLALSHVPLYVALDYLSKLANLKLKIDPYAVSIVPLTEPTDVLVTREYQVPPTFIPPKPIDNSGGLPQAGAGPDSSSLPRVAQRYNAQEYLASQGVDFPTGSSANYLPAGSKLVVRNTRDNIDQIDALVDAAMGVAPSQVEISTKFLEISQNNVQELGFDWLLGPFSIGGGAYGSGGSTNANPGQYPFSSAGMNPVGALRSGSQALQGNSINALLDPTGSTANTPAPGIFSIAGIFNDPQFQLVIRALNQKKGVDLMSAPKITTKSGVKATVKIVNEFIYPKQYDPPIIPQSTAQSGTTTTLFANNPSQETPPTITPAFPQNFTKEDLGVTLDAKPTIGPDGYTIDLELNPRVEDFDGFINYGSPISSVGYQRAATLSGGIVSMPVAEVLTTNTINQPVFTVREVNTFVTVWDGQTVALGGLITENVQKMQDKIPILGDIPVAGRLFRSDNDQKIKQNLIIFVTPKILDPEGQPRRGDTEEPEVVTPLGLPQDLPQPTLTSPALRTK